mgnify:CR=1 FL=1
MTVSEFASTIEHTRVAGNDTLEDIKEALDDAIKYHFGAVCVNPYYVPYASESLSGSGVEVCTGIGFPLGVSLLDVKIEELKRVVLLGADAVDYVINYSALKSGDWDHIAREIEILVKYAGSAITKLIIETCYLSKDEIARVSRMAADRGVQYIKTSTGMGPSGAQVEDVRLIADTIGSKAKIKASGGIRTLEQALELIGAGASRLGTSRGPALVEAYREKLLND